jgi:hypothetical protein
LHTQPQSDAGKFTFVTENLFMSDKSELPDEKNPKPKTLKISDLLPAKAVVETSIGRIYVRHVYTSDWKQFESEDAVELGRSVVQHLCNRVEDKSESGPLEEKDLEELSEADFCSLVPVVAQKNGWLELPMGAGLKELGNAAKAAKVQLLENHKKTLADMRKSIDLSYGFLGKDTLNKLQEQMAGLVDIRKAMSAAEGLGEINRELNQIGTLRGMETAQDRKFLMQTLPRPEDTLLGRATLESAENSREVAQKMDALVEIIAGLNQTMVKDVLPEWVKQVKSSQKDAKDSFDQAADGLKWTKWAVITSVVVTVLVTWWQVWVARDIDLENTQQQTRMEAILEKQLATQENLVKQLERDTAAMREEIAVLKSLAAAQPKK